MDRIHRINKIENHVSLVNNVKISPEIISSVQYFQVL